MVARVWEARNRAENPRLPLTSDSLLEALGAEATWTGKHLGVRGSLAYNAVWACVRVIAETVSTLPLVVYKQLPNGGKERATEHSLYRLLHDDPNPEMTSVELREALVGHLCLWGNAYANLVRDGRGRVLEIWPLRPDMTRPVRLRTGELAYEVRLPGYDELAYETGQSTGADVKILPADEVMHWRGLSFQGLLGYAPARLGRQNIALGLAQEEFAARFFGNDASPGGVLEYDGELDDKARGNLRKSWNQKQQGLDNAHRIAILEFGVKWHAVGIDPRNAQLLEARKLAVEDVARMWRMPLHKIQNMTASTNNNIEHQGIEFVQDTILPYCVRTEQRYNKDLLAPGERGRYFVKHLIDGLLRGDSKARAESLQIQKQNGVINADEWREIEDRNPIPDGSGKLYLVNAAMVKPGDVPQTSGTGGQGPGRRAADMDADEEGEE